MIRPRLACVAAIALLSVVILPAARAADAPPAAALQSAAPIVIANPGFEEGDAASAAGWSWWSRLTTGSATVSAEAHSGKRAILIRHDADRDWNLSNATRIPAKPGELYIARAWVRSREAFGFGLNAVARTADDKLVSWTIGAEGETSGFHDWKRIQTRILVPEDAAQFYLRFYGRGKTTVWVDDITIERSSVEALRGAPKPRVKGWAAERVREKIDRGIVALRKSEIEIYVGWRLLDTDPADIAFHVYRRTDAAAPVRLTSQPVARTTDYVDAEADLKKTNAWFVRPVAAGVEGAPSAEALLPPDAPARPYIAIPLQGKYGFQHVGVGDLDGDGRYDFVVKQPADNIDPYASYWKKSQETFKLEAYSADGRFLWRVDLGWAIEKGIWYSPSLVYDFDGDGRAEIAVKTGEGDPRDPDGRVTSGPEYVSILDGATGREITRADWPSREGFDGPSGYNYASRNQLGVAYLDGKTPCLIVARGTYGLMKCAAYTYRDGKLAEVWRWSNTEELPTYRGQGAHFMHCADVDADGRDEVVLGSCVIDDNGNGLWSTGLGHPDHCYLGDLDPTRPGLEIYYGIEPRGRRNKVCMADAATGKILWGITTDTQHVHSTGLCSDFDSRHPGMECYSGEKEYPSKEAPHRWLHSAQGLLIGRDKAVDMGLSPRAAYWDADLQREIVRGNRIYDFETGRPLYEALPKNQRMWADILGDWREEIVTYEDGEMRIYTTAIPAEDRRVCLMQDPIYRTDVAHLSMGYAQAPTTSYCLSAPPAASTR